MLALSWIEITHKTRQFQWKNALFIFVKFTRKKKKNSEIAAGKKTKQKKSKAVKENELTVTVKKAFMRIHFILEIYMYRQK